MNLFGKKKQVDTVSRPAAQDPIEVIKKLRDNLETLEKRENHISKKIEACITEAKQKAAKDRKGALFALKRKKMYEGEVSKLQGARITMDQQIMALESASVNIETFKALQSGAQAMKAVRGNIDADKVEDILDELEEEKEIHNAISDAISRPANDLYDDSELLDELSALEAEDLEEAAPVYAPRVTAPVAAPQPGPQYNLPAVPTGPVHMATASAHEEEDEEDRALRELQASMS